jgi:hexosaminidase
LEDDAPIRGPRAVFLIDIENPCWIYKDADLGHATHFVAAVGQLPFNFQIGADREQIHFPTPASAEGDLEVRRDHCDGDLLARLPLRPAVGSDTVTRLPEALLAAHGGHHDLCLRFAQPALDPLWAIDWVAVPGTDRPSP